MSAYLKIDHVCKTFARGATADEVLPTSRSTIEQGEYVSIIGHSGCGKSTLLNIVAGLLPATTGGVLLENREVNEPGPGSRGRVPEPLAAAVAHRLRQRRDRGEQGVRAARSRAAERHDWVMHNLELVQMAHAKDKRPAEISGGMKQRVGIARALAMEPKVLLLDEPFGALDALTRAHLQDSVMAIHAKLGNTVLMITHDVDEAVLTGISTPSDRRGSASTTTTCYSISSKRDQVPVLTANRASTIRSGPRTSRMSHRWK